MTRSATGTGKLLPFIGMMVAMLGQSGSMVVIKVAIKDINEYVMVVYTFALSAILVLPFAVFLHRRSQGPPINFVALCRFFLLASFGSLGTIQAYVGIDLSSPSLLSAILNLMPAFTFILALIFKMEQVHWRTSSSQAKVLGTIVSIAGAFVVILYKGPIIYRSHSNNFSDETVRSSSEINWILGGIMCVLDALFTSLWYIYQASVGDTYPTMNVSVIVFFQFLFSMVQCGAYAFFAVKDLSEWKLKADIGLIGILYQVIIATLLRYLLVMWCIVKAGPLFCALFQPVAIIFTVWMGAIFLGDDFSLGSLVGAAIIVIGFYAVQWGKSKEEYEIAKGVEHLDTESLSHGVPLLPERNT
ncbi:WAT1-related protein At5g40240 [Vigna radiata var. radiata]|uniref:WAT1-related protein n=1 Tax=Vigna radiata var. radiata TaxID=3916 RepID=A0A1S3VYD6_VIGRR|nr:WAT1-related protein At5g40240 [Vigna radiata var. radiata]